MKKLSNLKRKGSCFRNIQMGSLFAIFTLLTFNSCGKTKEKEVDVSNTEITGTMKDFVKVVDGTYKFTNNGKEAFITVQFELINLPDGEVAPILDKTMSANLILTPLDEDGNIIDLGIYGFQADYKEQKKLNELIFKGKKGDKKRISFVMNYFDQNENGHLIFKNATSFEIQDEAFSYSSEDAYNEEANFSESSETVNNNNDYDTTLDSYERYINNYIALLKKYKNGDLSVMEEYTEMMSDAQKFGEDLSNAQGQLTSAQTKRWLDLQNKFSKAMVDIAE